MARWLAGLELLVAAALWGFGFVASVWALQRLSPAALTFWRFALASLVVLPILFVSRWRMRLIESLGLAFWPGVFFAATLILQTWGLRYTTATKSGFLTTLYVVFVPCLEAFLGKQKMSRALWLCVLGAFLGTVMIVNQGLTDINKGDLLTILCALLATGQIYMIGMVSPRVQNPFIFNIAQILWATLTCAPVYFLSEPTGASLRGFADWPTMAQWGLSILVLGSTLVAFTLQVRAQAYLRPTVSSILFLLESPFAMVFAAYWLGDRLGQMEAIGAGMIIVSALGATFSCFYQDRKASFLSD